MQLVEDPELSPLLPAVTMAVPTERTLPSATQKY